MLAVLAGSAALVRFFVSCIASIAPTVARMGRWAFGIWFNAVSDLVIILVHISGLKKLFTGVKRVAEAVPATIPVQKISAAVAAAKAAPVKKARRTSKAAVRAAKSVQPKKAVSRVKAAVDAVQAKRPSRQKATASA